MSFLVWIWPNYWFGTLALAEDKNSPSYGSGDSDTGSRPNPLSFPPSALSSTQTARRSRTAASAAQTLPHVPGWAFVHESVFSLTLPPFRHRLTDRQRDISAISLCHVLIQIILSSGSPANTFHPSIPLVGCNSRSCPRLSYPW
jgi:hypothetical protein